MNSPDPLPSPTKIPGFWEAFGAYLLSELIAVVRIMALYLLVMFLLTSLVVSMFHALGL